MNSTIGFHPNGTIHIPTNHTGNILHNFHYIFTTAYGINLLLGLPTNSYVLWLIVTGAGSGVASEFFALNLSVSDIIYCLSTVIAPLEFYVSRSLTPAYRFIFGFIDTGRPLFQCCVCMERYLAVVHPVAFLRYRPLRYRVGCSAVVWLVILVSCLICLFKGYTSVYIYTAIVQYLVLFSVKLFCCLAVLRALKQPGPGEGGREREGENHMKKRAFRIILIILVSTVVSYMPVLIVMCFYDVLTIKEFVFAKSIAFSITVITGFLHPLLYLHRAGKLPFIRGL